jgi:hypothetical protein
MTIAGGPQGRSADYQRDVLGAAESVRPDEASLTAVEPMNVTAPSSTMSAAGYWDNASSICWLMLSWSQGKEEL